MTTRRSLAFAVGAGLLLVACAEAGPTGLRDGREALLERTAEGPQVVEGTIGGASYRIHMPADWNGRLILYSHGYQNPAGPAVLPFEDPILGPVFAAMQAEVVESLGYALAYSSFRSSGYAVKEGALATHQLRGIFASHFGRPARTYLAGHSLGGMAALMLAEEHPAHYDGALVMCSFPGGSREEIDYVYNVRAVFDYFDAAPLVLPGSLFTASTALDFPTFAGTYLPGIASVLSSSGGLPAFALAALDQTRVEMNLADPFEVGVGSSLALYFHVLSATDLRERAHGHPFFGNAGTQYSGPLPAEVLAGLNAGVERVSSTPDAESYTRRYYEPTGDLRIPVLTLHTTRDPVTPHRHEALFAARVAAAGASDRLVQWDVPGFGHCSDLANPASFHLATVQALQALTAWAENDVAPPASPAL